MRRVSSALSGLTVAFGFLRATNGFAAEMYHQNYNPTGNAFLSTLVAAIPILALLYFIALHPHRDKQGHRHLGISAPYAAFFGVIAAFLVSCLAFGMPFAVGGFGIRLWFAIRLPGDHLDCPRRYVPLHHDGHHRQVRDR